MKTRIAAIAGFLVVLIALVVGVVRSARRETPGATGLAPTAPAGRPPAPANAPTDNPPDQELDRPVVLGEVKGDEASITARVPAKVLSISGQVGTRVARGQVVVTLDDRDVKLQADQARQDANAAAFQVVKARAGRDLKLGEIEAQIQEAQAGVTKAEGQLAKAKDGLQATMTAADSDIAQAKAGVAAAQAQLQAARKGARPEDIARAQHAVDNSRQAMELAKNELDQLRYLFEQKAIAKVQVDKAEGEYIKARAEHQDAVSVLAKAKAGAAPEDMAAAQANLDKATAGLRAAEDGKQDRIRIAQKDVSLAQLQVEDARRGVQQAIGGRKQIALVDEDIRSAEAKLKQANAQAELAGGQVQNTRLASPIDGVITRVDVNVGEMASPGRPLVAIAGTTHLWVEASVPTRLLPSFRKGQAVDLEIDVGGRRVHAAGAVRELSTAANPDGRSYTARIDFTPPVPSDFRPAARVRVATRAAR